MFLLLSLFISFIKSFLPTFFLPLPVLLSSSSTFGIVIYCCSYYGTLFDYHIFIYIYIYIYICIYIYIYTYMLFLQPLFMSLFNLQSSLLVFLVVHNICIIVIPNIFVVFTFIIIFINYYLQLIYL